MHHIFRGCQDLVWDIVRTCATAVHDVLSLLCLEIGFFHRLVIGWILRDFIVEDLFCSDLPVLDGLALLHDCFSTNLSFFPEENCWRLVNKLLRISFIALEISWWWYYIGRHSPMATIRVLGLVIVALTPFLRFACWGRSPLALLPLSGTRLLPPCFFILNFNFLNELLVDFDKHLTHV